MRGNAVGRQTHREPTQRLGPYPARLIAGLVALALVAGLGTWLVVDRVWGWEEYTGDQYNEAALRLEHPQEWAPVLHSGQFVVFGPTDLTSLFTPDSDWARVRALAASDPDQVVGAYVNSTGWLNLAGLEPLADQVAHQFATSATIEATEQQPAGAPTGAKGLVGSMRPSRGAPIPRLYFEFVAINTSRQQGSVLLFCLEENKSDNAATFKRVLESVRLPS